MEPPGIVRSASIRDTSFASTALALLLSLVGASIPAAEAADPAKGGDAFADAEEIHGIPWTLTADLAGATREDWEFADPDLHGQTRWWRWTAPESGVVGWDSSNSPSPTSVAVFESDRFLRRRLVSESFLRPTLNGSGFLASYQPVPERLGSFQVERAATYWIRLDSVRRSDPIFTPSHDPQAPLPVTVTFAYLPGPAPANDTFSNAAPLSLSASEIRGRLEVATLEPGEPRPHAASAGRTLWWTWTAAGTGSARLRVDPASRAPLFNVFRRGTYRELVLAGSSATEYGNACTRYPGSRSSLAWDTTAGETYSIQADAFPEFDRTAEFRARLEFTPAPTNDSMLSPLEFVGTEVSVVASNDGATRSSIDPTDAGFQGTSSVWYRWILPGTGLIQITTNEPTRFAEPEVEVLPPVGTWLYGSEFTTTTGPCSGPLEDLHPSPPFQPIFSVFYRFGTSQDQPLLSYVSHGTNEVWAEPRGTELWVQMDSPEGTTGQALLNARFTPPPSNDRKDRAIPLPSAPVRVTGRSAGATREIDETLPASTSNPGGGRVVPERSVWWEWKAPTTGTWALVPSVGVYDHTFAIYRTTESQPGDPTVSTELAPAFFHADEGERLSIGVFGRVGRGGNLEFKIREAAAPNVSRPVRYDAFGESWWVFDGLAGWDLPFAVEASENLVDWQPVLADWVPKAPTLRVRIPFGYPSYFVRFRAETASPP